MKRGGGSRNPALVVSAVTAQKLSVTEDATDSLDVSIPLSQAATLQQGRDGPLMRDINMLTDILADIVQRESPRIHDLFEEFRGYGVERYVCSICSCAKKQTLDVRFFLIGLNFLKLILCIFLNLYSLLLLLLSNKYKTKKQCQQS